MKSIHPLTLQPLEEGFRIVEDKRQRTVETKKLLIFVGILHVAHKIH
jgi:hypothetical protein